MSERSNIQWTDSSWNPCTGCTKISKGCKNCYAERLANRLKKINPKGKYRNGFRLTLHENDINLPLKWKTPRTIFVNSMSDLFHKDVPDSFIMKVFETMRKANWHTFQILTKRPERMEHFTNSVYTKMLPNVWLGTTIENKEVLHRLDHLKKTLAMVKFISFEPLIGPLGKIDLDAIDWIIVGGESGPEHRPMKKEWVIKIMEQAKSARVPFFFKQWGGLTPKSNGRLLDGKIYSQYPRYKRNLLDFKNISISEGFHAQGECSCIGRLHK